jgi:hypothetical protein
MRVLSQSNMLLVAGLDLTDGTVRYIAGDAFYIEGHVHMLCRAHDPAGN